MSTVSKPPAEQKEQWHKDPDNWVLGIFYFNRADKRIFPPKKFKAMGWTVNFANPYSLIMLACIAVILFSSTLLVY